MIEALKDFVFPVKEVYIICVYKLILMSFYIVFKNNCYFLLLPWDVLKVFFFLLAAFKYNITGNIGLLIFFCFKLLDSFSALGIFKPRFCFHCSVKAMLYLLTSFLIPS